MVTYCDPSSAALIRGQFRAQPGYETRLKVQELARDPKTGKFLDAYDGTEIIGTPELGHIRGREYTNELQRAFANGQSESAFRESMKDPSIYQLESVTGNRSHLHEAPQITIDSFENVKKEIGNELWKKLSTQ